MREFCTFNRGTGGGGGVTRIGSRNWIMAYVHVAHDCQVGSDVTMANGSTLAGHVSVGDHVTLGAFTVVHQFCSIGDHSFSAGFGNVTKFPRVTVDTAYGLFPVGSEIGAFALDPRAVDQQVCHAATPSTLGSDRRRRHRVDEPSTIRPKRRPGFRSSRSRGSIGTRGPRCC